MKCSFCRGPFHIASGDLFGPQDYPLCGACVKEMRGWLRGHLNRKWSKVSFYAHATVPPPAAPDRRFMFTLFFRQGKTNVFHPQKHESSGLTFEEAQVRLQERFPDVMVPSEHLKGMWEELP